MSEKTNLDGIRNSAWDKIERTEKNYKMSFYALAIIEFVCLLGFTLAADFSNRIHLLLFLTMIGIYSIIGFALVTLGTWVSHNTQILLKAINALDESKNKME